MCTRSFYGRGARCLAVLHNPTTSPHPQMTVTQHGTKANTRHHLGSGTHPGTMSQPARLAESRTTSGAGLRKARLAPRPHLDLAETPALNPTSHDEGLRTGASGAATLAKSKHHIWCLDSTKATAT